MPDGERQARLIQTRADAAAVVASPVASFVELMECVAVARAHEDWELRYAAAERAFDLIEATQASAHGRLPQAADAVIESFLRRAAMLSDLPPQIGQARDWLDIRRPRIRDARLENYFSKRDGQLAELLVLLSDDGPWSLVKLSSRLRQVDRSDLAVHAATRALGPRPESVAALTTLGAAHCDLGAYLDAERCLRRALELSPKDSSARTALSRVLQKSGRLVAALDEAKVAFAHIEDMYTAHRLIAAATALGDEIAIDEAAEAIERAAMHIGGEVDPFILMIAAEVLLEQRQFERAQQLLSRLGVLGISGGAARRFVELKRAIEQESRTLLLTNQ